MITIEADGQLVGLRTIKFSGGEVQPRLLEPPGKVSEIKITARIWSSDDLMELLLVTEACQDVWRAAPIHLVLPYLPYARQDRACHPGEAFSLNLMCRLLIRTYYASIEIWDPHSNVTRQLLGANANYRSAQEFVRLIPLNWPSTVIVAPDHGAFQRAVECAASLECQMICATKTRDPNTGELGEPRISATPNEILRDPDFLIVDDICDGGRTFVNLAKVLRPLTEGKIYLYVTHGIFSAGFSQLREAIDHIYVANLHPHERAGDYLTVLT